MVKVCVVWRHTCGTNGSPFNALCRRRPNEAVSLDYLKKLGVLYWRVDGEDDPKLQAIRDARGYSYKVSLPGSEGLPAAHSAHRCRSLHVCQDSQYHVPLRTLIALLLPRDIPSRLVITQGYMLPTSQNPSALRKHLSGQGSFS